MKAVVAAFNQEKALVGAFSVITNLRMELFQALLPTCTCTCTCHVQAGHLHRLHLLPLPRGGDLLPAARLHGPAAAVLGAPQLRVRTLRGLRPPLSQAHTGPGGGLEVPGGDQSLQREHPCWHPLLYIVGSIYLHPCQPTLILLCSCPSWELDDENSTNFVVKSICVGEPGELLMVI